MLTYSCYLSYNCVIIKILFAFFHQILPAAESVGFDVEKHVVKNSGPIIFDAEAAWILDELFAKDGLFR